MKRLRIRFISIFSTLCLSIFLFAACQNSGKKTIQSPSTINLASNNWQLWLDTSAKWKEDSLYLPPVDLSRITKNPPTCGWDNLNKLGKTVHLPATIEEHYWDRHGNEYGISGNYKGVAWYTTTLNIPESYQGKHLFLDFQSVRVRAEVYVNGQLTGYDLLNGTPFAVDITDVVQYGKDNQIAVRVTDPAGNFTWRDYTAYQWGDYMIPPSHGFGGITGDIKLRLKSSIYIQEVFIKNHPEPDEVSMKITLNQQGSGHLKIELSKKDQNKVLLKNRLMINKLKQVSIPIEYNKAKLWSPEDPNLYTATIIWEGKDNSRDSLKEHFGFRWFKIKEPNGDRQFYLNDKRMVLRSAISWGFWPVNGYYATDSMAEKQIDMAKKLGLNMLNFHRRIGQPNILELADEKGLLYYEEPGGYVNFNGTEFTRKWARKRLYRMIKRDRNHPSLIIYNMQNENTTRPDTFDKETIKKAHQLDETRYITYTSTYFPSDFYGGKAPKGKAQIKLHMTPYDHTPRYKGWWDEHHAGGPGVYADEFYNGPDDFRRNSKDSSEIIFWGEEGAIGTPPDLQSIGERIVSGSKKGWDGADYLAQYRGYQKFLKEKNFYNAFPHVGALTRSLGNVAHYYQGRMIENIRISNIVDGYVINGWESMKLENQSGIVDCYRNSKGNTEILAHYNQPQYIAVKARKKVMPVGDSTLVDIYMINEKGLEGDYMLHISARDSNGTFYNRDFQVSLKGVPVYGQLLKEKVVIKPSTPGHSTIEARLSNSGDTPASGQEKLFTVRREPEKVPSFTLWDPKRTWANIFQNMGIRQFDVLNPVRLPSQNSVLVATYLPEAMAEEDALPSPLLEWVMNGNKLIILEDAGNWAEYLKSKEIIDYRGKVTLGTVWHGGNYFVKNHEFFRDLPVNTAFNWEYQDLALYSRERTALRLGNGETVVGAQKDTEKELFSALTVFPVGQGKIILSALDLRGAIRNGGSSTVVPKKIVENYLRFAGEK